MPELCLTHEHGERTVTFAVTGAPDVPPQYLCDDPTAVPPMRPAQVRAAYRSRAGAPWALDTVHIRGRYAPDDPASRWVDLPGGGLWLYPSSPHYPDHPKPPWTAALACALAVPAPEVAAGPVRATVTSDRAKRTRFFTLDGLDEISHWPMPAPLRPDKVRVTYLNSGDTAWGLDEIRFEGPYVATGKTPGPNQNRGRRNYYPASLRDAPAWVRDLADAHRVPDPLPAGQRP